MTNQEVLEACCAFMYQELERLNLQPGKEDWVRHGACISELVDRIKQRWIEEFGGDPLKWPWNDGYVVLSYIQYRKKNKQKKAFTGVLPGTLFKQDQGLVYFIENSRGHIKIGWTNNIKGRFSNLQTAESEPIKVLGHFPGSVGTEDALHFRFAAYKTRSNSEWFFSSPALRSLIRQKCQ
jgi:hypothetical protein